MNFFSTADTQSTMIDPIEAFEDFLADPALVHAPDLVPFPTAAHVVHNWTAIAPADILNYFDARSKDYALNLFSLQLPTGAPAVPELVLFSEDNVRHHSYSVVRQNPNRFGRLHIKLMEPYFVPPLNAIVFAYGADNATDNIAQVTIHVDQYLKHLDWSNTPGNSVIVAAKDVDLGTIRALGVALPASVEIYDGVTWGFAAPGDWHHAGTTLQLFESTATGLQRQWRINY
jgi:hypothetical protein